MFLHSTPSKAWLHGSLFCRPLCPFVRLSINITLSAFSACLSVRLSVRPFPQYVLTVYPSVCPSISASNSFTHMKAFDSVCLPVLQLPRFLQKLLPLFRLKFRFLQIHFALLFFRKTLFLLKNKEREEEEKREEDGDGDD